MDKLAKMKGRLLKGGEPDFDKIAKILLSDWARGEIPYFVPPPELPEEPNKAEIAASRDFGNHPDGFQIVQPVAYITTGPENT